jgi:limonene-1,2-epoxide hydrolase
MTEQPTDMATQTESSNIRTVETFLNTLRDQDFDTMATLLDDHLVYQNVGFSTIRGGRRTLKVLRGMQGRMGFDVKIHRTAADGPVVLNERTDVMTFGPVRLQFWVCGVFEVHSGRITLWRDYLDAFDFGKAILRGLAGVVVPRLCPTL